MRIAITGSSGLVGTALSHRLQQSGHDVVPVVRDSAAAGQISWSIDERRLDPADLEGVDAVVHLAGAGIGDRRWTDSYKQEIISSRTEGTTLIAEAIAASGSPSVLVSGSAIGAYGERGDEQVDETSELGDGFLADVCRSWEAATAAAESADVRVVHIRTGIVLSQNGGALKKMLPLFKFWLGGRFGDGTQWMSWISIHDEVRAIEHLLTSSVSGPVNLTAPDPVQNRRFADVLGEALGRPARLPVPEFGPKILLGRELADALLFDGQRVTPTVLLDDGFRFDHPDLAGALRAVLLS